LEDGAAATAFVRNPANARVYNIDIDRVVLAGHPALKHIPVLMITAETVSRRKESASPRRSRRMAEQSRRSST